MHLNIAKIGEPEAALRYPGCRKRDKACGERASHQQMENALEAGRGTFLPSPV